MDEGKINALAREYAEKIIDPCGFSKDTYEELVEEKAESVTCVLRWLSQRFCLVEKDKAREVYLEAKVTTKRAINPN